MATAAKMARGAMARYAITAGIDRPEELKGFDSLGYRFSPERSTGQIYRFYQQ
ncbi:MAG: peroxide stress protein YaaA [Christensenellaceae bacterium]